jgi:hypothetical protein
MPTLDTTPTFVLAIGANGQLTVSQLVAGDLTSATLSQLFTAQRDIAGATKLLEAEIIKNIL